MRDMSKLIGRLGLCFFCISASLLRAGGPQLNKIERSIAKEPAYVAERPLYGVYVFGPQGQTRVWAVLDKSRPGAADYDILYFDRNADGDLTAADERIEGKVTGQDVTFDIGSFTDPATGQKHTGLSIRRRSSDSGGVMLTMNWCDKVLIRGGYAPASGPYTQFAATREEAPVLWPGAELPLGFQFWELKPLVIGQASDVEVFLGHQGLGKNTFCALPDSFLPKEVPVLVTLVYIDQQGKERRAQSELRERC
jgi:hypothetical protein